MKRCCVLSSPPVEILVLKLVCGFFVLFFFFFFFFNFKESDRGASWTAHNETAGRNNVTVRHNPTTRNLTDTQWTHVTLGIATPSRPPQLSQNTGLLKLPLVRC